MEAVAGGQWKARLGREVIVKSCENVNVMPWPQDLASGVIGPGAWTGHKSQPQPE